MSPGTSLLIADLQQSTDLSFHEIKQCRKRIKKSAAKDKNFGSSALQWRTARSIRAPFTPRPVNLYDISGKLTPKHKRPTVFAEYLSEKVWKAPPELGPIPVDLPPPTDCGSFFSMGELNIVLRSLRTGRLLARMELSRKCSKALLIFLNFFYSILTIVSPLPPLQIPGLSRKLLC